MRISGFRVAFKLKRNFNTSSRLAIHGMNASNVPVEFLPPIDRSMRQLDRSHFQKTVLISAATVFNLKDTSFLKKTLDSTKESLSVFPIKNFVPDPEVPGARCLLLKPGISPMEPETWSNSLKELSEQGKLKVHPYELKLSYNDWSMRTILDAVLPEMDAEETETPAGFATVGHIAHVNLRRQYLPYKSLIGQVLLDRNPHITTVINKLNDVGTENEYRTFPYEVLAGQDNLDVLVTAQDCEFKFNYGKVYWNIRLDREHLRVIDKFKPGEAVCDVMAGVGPFSIPAGKRKVFVWANDLNPDSHEALEWAIRRNDVRLFVKGYKQDGRDFIRWATATLPASRRTVTEVEKHKKARNVKPPVQVKGTKATKIDSKTFEEPETFDHYVMNLPKIAVEFLDTFQGLYQGRESLFEPQTSRKLPMVHLYLFTDREGAATAQTEAEETKVCKTISQHLKHDITPQTPDVELLYVSLVSPSKKYYRASFRLPPEVAFASNFVPFHVKTAPAEASAEASLESKVLAAIEKTEFSRARRML
jgi:tRNA (guanine37-N1)-methyltransferase